MFVVKANPIAPTLLPPPSCAPARGRRRGRQSAPAPSPAPRGNPIAGVRMACALRARAKRGALGETFANQYSLGPNPFSLSPSSIAAQENALRIPTDVAGASALNAAVWNALHPPQPPPTLSPDQQAYANRLRTEGQAGYNISEGLYHNNLQQVKTGVQQLPGSIKQQVTDNGGLTLDQLKDWLKHLFDHIPWWAWAAGGAVGLLALKNAMR